SWLAARSFLRGPTRRLSRRGHNKGNNRRCSGGKTNAPKQMPRGSRNDSRTYRPCTASWEADKVYAGGDPADQECGRKRKEAKGDRGVDRGDPWFPASHLLKVGCQSAATNI